MDTKNLTADEKTRLLDLLYSELRSVSRGETFGYGQPKENELEDISQLIAKLEVN